MLTIDYHVNITTIIVFLFGVVAFYLGVLRQQDKQASDRIRISDLEERLKNQSESHQMLVLNFTSYKETMSAEIRQMVSTSYAREMEERMTKRISETEDRMVRTVENIGSRLDGFLNKFVAPPA